MNAESQIVNFCNKFFDPNSGLKTTDQLLKDCGTINLRDAQRSRAAVLVHEASHTTYAMQGMGPDGAKALDYAYGFVACTQLPRGAFDRSCVPYRGSKALCGNAAGTEGVCEAHLSALNADTYSFVSAGVYFSQKCNREIQFPPPPIPIQSRSSESQNARGDNPILPRAGLGQPGNNILNACPVPDEYLVIDGEDEPTTRVRGYAHFGDSFASGMGTGSTSWDSCRVGSNNCKSFLDTSPKNLQDGNN